MWFKASVALSGSKGSKGFKGSKGSKGSKGKYERNTRGLRDGRAMFASQVGEGEVCGQKAK